jgi:lipid-A-disaccharide synthase
MNILITAGDPSGDAHAARLMEALRARVPDVVFEGFGGPAMEMQGLRSVAHLKDVAVSGFWEVAKRFGYLRSLLNTCEQMIKHRKPDLFIPVDYPGFNIRLAAVAKQALVPVAWYIAPQLWAWGRNRARELARVVSTLLVVFPFEKEYFDAFGINTVYVGHPLLDMLAQEELVDGDRTQPDTHEKNIVLVPGSREHELKHHIPPLVDVVKHFRGSEFSFVVPKAPSLSDEAMQPFVNVGAHIVHDSHAAMRRSYAGLVKAGTSTLEATLIGVPYGSFYKTSLTSYLLAKRLVNVNSVTMMNLLLDSKVVHEYIQQQVTVKNLVSEIEDLVSNIARRRELTDAMAQVRQLLGNSGAASRAADAIVRLM